MKNLLTIICSYVLSSSALHAQDFALEQLENSPRHHEWVEVPSGDRTVHSFVAYPEKSEDALAVIVIHENRGLTDWVRSFADQMAAAGYIAIAPDLLSGFSADAPKTSDFASSDAARDAIYQLDPEQVTQDLQAVRAYIADVPASNGKVAVMGFCWGGSQTFRFATNSDQIVVAMPFYGTAPEAYEAIEQISVPVYGFYGENDQRVNATLESTAAMMKKADNTYEYEIYKGAGHAYMRNGDDPQGDKASKEAKAKSMERVKNILSQYE
ncbi:dienelactone hydrolase family protein [Catalinimonas niigatensis]|uniref:dienelactone hydrolase family protein n=1 Tax=Catalinimonas niigatensis TaxID=1397264 RepID=UPI0026651F09|nr:dienelactone hydrolase family protein [Catalinimonas niigatensis]WPP52832.1 dienelactone hydrolase family protein [Catalinimonas niigatensis]